MVVLIALCFAVKIFDFCAVSPYVCFHILVKFM